MRAVAVLALLIVVVSAIPVSKQKLALQAKARNPDAAAGAAPSAVGPPHPKAPVLSSSFHTKYSIYLLNAHIPFMPHTSGWINGHSKLIDGEAWQNIAPTGLVTIKTHSKPSLIGSVLTPETTQTWVENHGWTEKAGVCTKDAKNDQLVIPGDVLTKSGVFKGVKNIFPPHAVTDPKPNADGSYTVAEWFATLPNNEGTVTYYLLGTSTTPIMSHYSLTGKPPVFAQYDFVTPVVNPPATYLPSAICVAASK